MLYSVRCNLVILVKSVLLVHFAVVVVFIHGVLAFSFDNDE